MLNNVVLTKSARPLGNTCKDEAVVLHLTGCLPWILCTKTQLKIAKPMAVENSATDACIHTLVEARTHVHTNYEIKLKAVAAVASIWYASTTEDQIWHFILKIGSINWASMHM